MATAAALADAIRAQEAAGGPFDLILFGNESADSGGFQVGIRVADALGSPVRHRRQGASRSATGPRGPGEAPGGWEVFEVPLPAVVARQRGASTCRATRRCPGRLRAKKKEIERVTPRASGRRGSR